ncbi:MAG: N-acetylmuramoyl-L-alanine amidase [Chloroflexi bacterium]|nr:N-acetylmuramoyl-L-alanine amidase [Chloroflexota bacterium]
MQSHRAESRRQTPLPFWLRLLRHNVPIILFLVLALVGMGAVYWYFSPGDGEAIAITGAVTGQTLSAPIFKNAPTEPAQQRLAQSAPPLRIGIIAGHKEFDSGAVCDDGLTEASVNVDIAERLVANLGARGIRAEVLAEFDARLAGYTATGLISIHADSCQYVNELATGFKISSSTFNDSSRLASCMEAAYGAATQLPYHANTITADMANYHAFHEIAPDTPAIIIEIGFMNLDRELLTANTDPVVIGLINGVTCFLEDGG